MPEPTEPACAWYPWTNLRCDLDPGHAGDHEDRHSLPDGTWTWAR